MVRLCSCTEALADFVDREVPSAYIKDVSETDVVEPHCRCKISIEVVAQMRWDQLQRGLDVGTLAIEMLILRCDPNGVKRLTLGLRRSEKNERAGKH